jgi:hypothetical protein
VVQGPRARLLLGEQCRDRPVRELVADHPAVPLRGDHLRRAQVTQRLGHGRVVEARRGGEIRHADRSCRLDTSQQGEPGRVTEEGERLRAGLNVSHGANGLDRLAHALAIDDPVPGPLGRKQMHTPTMPLCASAWSYDQVLAQAVGFLRPRVLSLWVPKTPATAPGLVPFLARCAFSAAPRVCCRGRNVVDGPSITYRTVVDGPFIA